MSDIDIGEVLAGKLTPEELEKFLQVYDDGGMEDVVYDTLLPKHLNRHPEQFDPNL